MKKGEEHALLKFILNMLKNVWLTEKNFSGIISCMTALRMRDVILLKQMWHHNKKKSRTTLEFNVGVSPFINRSSTIFVSFVT